MLQHKKEYLMFSPKKAAYNKALNTAREALVSAQALRAALVAEDSHLSGPSTQALSDAIVASFTAKTFTGYDGDIKAEDNPYRPARTARAAARPATAARR